MNAEYAYQFFRSRGLSHAAAAGIVGNFDVESGGFDPDVLSGTRRGDSGSAAYVGQWRGQRLNNLNKLARSKGEARPSFDTQLEFTLEELDPNSQFADPIAAKNRGAILNASSPEAAAQSFMQHFERPHRDPNINHVARRTRVASSLNNVDVNQTNRFAPQQASVQSVDVDSVSGRILPPALDTNFSHERLAPIQASKIPGDLGPLEVRVNNDMGPLFASYKGASSRVKPGAVSAAKEIINGPHQRAGSWYKMFTGEELPPINDFIAKDGTSRERNTPNSQHFKGRAIDYGQRGMTDAQKMAHVEASQLGGFDGFGFGSNILHADTGGARGWGYGNSKYAGLPVSEWDAAVSAGQLPDGIVREAKGAPIIQPRPAVAQDVLPAPPQTPTPTLPTVVTPRPDQAPQVVAPTPEQTPVVTEPLLGLEELMASSPAIGEPQISLPPLAAAQELTSTPPAIDVLPAPPETLVAGLPAQDPLAPVSVPTGPVSIPPAPEKAPLDWLTPEKPSGLAYPEQNGSILPLPPKSDAPITTASTAPGVIPNADSPAFTQDSIAQLGTLTLPDFQSSDPSTGATMAPLGGSDSSGMGALFAPLPTTPTPDLAPPMTGGGGDALSGIIGGIGSLLSAVSGGKGETGAGFAEQKPVDGLLPAPELRQAPEVEMAAPANFGFGEQDFFDMEDPKSGLFKLKNKQFGIG